jgi:uncharacterized membrane protein
MRIALLIHLLASIVWIGGMFFAYVALRPAAARVLEPPQRLSLWQETLGRFFVWVWISIAALHATGLHMLASAYGLHAAPVYVIVMFGIAAVMTLVFAYIYFGPFKTLVRLVADGSWQPAAAAMNRIRRLVAANLALGLLTVAVAIMGGLLA